jgi:hypothetical protein
MKINRLETHDRLQHLKKEQTSSIVQGLNDCLFKNEYSLALQEKSPYIYIFAHPRTHDNGVDKVMYWQPRLLKPEAQTNSYLFRAISKSDLVEPVWMIPPEEMWPEYKKGNVTEHEVVLWSIDQYINNKKGLERSEPDDLSEEQAKNILMHVFEEHKQDLKMKKMYVKPGILGAFLTF